MERSRSGEPSVHFIYIYNAAAGFPSFFTLVACTHTQENNTKPLPLLLQTEATCAGVLRRGITRTCVHKKAVERVRKVVSEWSEYIV